MDGIALRAWKRPAKQVRAQANFILRNWHRVTKMIAIGEVRLLVFYNTLPSGPWSFIGELNKSVPNHSQYYFASAQTGLGSR
jgi:hypothetical protein